MLHRISLLMAATTAALALAAAPALAQDDDDDDDDDGGGAVTQTAPQGGIQTGAGGTADAGPEALAAGLAGGTLLLVATAGGLALRRRESA